MASDAPTMPGRVATLATWVSDGPWRAGVGGRLHVEARPRTGSLADDEGDEPGAADEAPARAVGGRLETAHLGPRAGPAPGPRGAAPPAPPRGRAGRPA